MKNLVTDVIMFYVQEFMAVDVQKLHHCTNPFEQRIERITYHLLSAKYVCNDGRKRYGWRFSSERSVINAMRSRLVTVYRLAT